MFSPTDLSSIGIERLVYDLCCFFEVGFPHRIIINIDFFFRLQIGTFFTTPHRKATYRVDVVGVNSSYLFAVLRPFGRFVPHSERAVLIEKATFPNSSFDHFVSVGIF